MNDKNETPKIIRLVETDSTNNYLREQSAKARLPEGSLVIADFQTAGKGQVGNSWESEVWICEVSTDLDKPALRLNRLEALDDEAVHSRACEPRYLIKHA